MKNSTLFLIITSSTPRARDNEVRIRLRYMTPATHLGEFIDVGSRAENRKKASWQEALCIHGKIFVWSRSTTESRLISGQVCNEGHDDD